MFIPCNLVWEFHQLHLGLCSSRKYPYSPHRRDWNFLGVGGFFETKEVKEVHGA